MMKLVFLCAVVFILPNIVEAQSIIDLERLPAIQEIDLKEVPGLPDDTLKPIYYGDRERHPGSTFGYITEPADSLKLLGCRGDFNNDGTTDYTLYIRDTRNNQDRLVAFVTGKDSVYPLSDWNKPLNAIAEETPYSRGLSTVKCRKMPKTGEVTILYGEKVKMNGDMITYGWYSYLWNGEDGFKEILTSD